jgi:transposase
MFGFGLVVALGILDLRRQGGDERRGDFGQGQAVLSGVNVAGRLDPETRACVQRREAEGKTRMETMRCLKRHLARRYYRLLSDRSRHRIEYQVYPGVP